MSEYKLIEELVRSGNIEDQLLGFKLLSVQDPNIFKFGIHEDKEHKWVPDAFLRYLRYVYKGADHTYRKVSLKMIRREIIDTLCL